jgi:pimeloyl-ACP methyl ester carboxylesterase
MSHFAVRAGRGTLAVSSVGQGRAIVFLHAAACDRRMWWAQLGALSDRFRVAAYDRRGFGEASPPTEQHSQVRDLDAVLESLDADSGILVASSEGCRVAVDYALAHPDRVDGLVLVSPCTGTLPATASQPDTVQRLLDEIELARRAGDIVWLSRLMAHAWLDGPVEVDGRVAGNTRLLFLDMAAGALRRDDSHRDTAVGDAYRRIRELTQPIAIICGALDFPHVIQRGRMLAETGRRADFHLMKGMAHFPGLEAPGRFNTLLGRVVRTM